MESDIPLKTAQVEAKESGQAITDCLGISELTVQDPAEESSKLVQAALSNSAVLQHIFKLLPLSSLKSCSLVNKFWKVECYTHLRESRRWIARIPKKSTCTSLQEFNELIGAMTLVPYNGLDLHLDQKHHPCRCTTCRVFRGTWEDAVHALNVRRHVFLRYGPEGIEELEKREQNQRNLPCTCIKCQPLKYTFENLLDKMSLRHLNVVLTLDDKPNENKSEPCPVMEFALTLLKKNIAELESLGFGILDELQPRFDPKWPPQLPKLMTIDLAVGGYHTWNLDVWKNLPTSFGMRLISAAVNLQEVSGCINYSTLARIPEKWGLVKGFEFEHHANGNELRICSDFISVRPMLRKLTVKSVNVAPHKRDDVILHAFLELGQSTLEDLRMVCDYCDRSYNWDMAFCGLTLEEVELLRRKDDEFLKAVQIVPIAPCVLTMQNLRSFTVEYPRNFHGLGFCIGRVSRLLASRYLPKLRMKLFPRPQDVSFVVY